MKHLHHYLLWAIAALLIPVSTAGCSSSNDEGLEVPAGQDFDISVVLPSGINLKPGGDDYTFAVNDGKAPLPTDDFMLQGSGGVSFKAQITAVTDKNFTVHFGRNIVADSYRFYIRRGDRRKDLGVCNITIMADAIEPAPGANLYGLVQTESGPLEGVVVSDGVEVVLTDADGVYNINSKKTYGYVFISLPGGYEVGSDGVLPRCYSRISSDPAIVDRADFSLKAISNPDNYKVLFFGDMHLAKRTNDLNQFLEFADDINDYRKQHSAEHVYAITLGDMTWDLYWKNFSFTEYLKHVNDNIKDLQIFHTMGNHDNDMTAHNDFDAEKPYRSSIAPNFYSFNLGKVHYVVLDDIDCSAYDGSNRSYAKSVSQDQLAWLDKDLRYVSKSTPVVITAHAPFFRPTKGTTSFHYDHDVTNTTALLNLLNGYKVHFVTGHTHMNFNVPSDAAAIAGRNITEHNVAAVCADWWWSGYLTPGVHLSCDGAPAGYAIYDVRGTEMAGIYKGTGRPETEQFHAYDLNNVSFSLADVPDMPSSYASEFKKYMDAYPGTADNKVLINVWNYDPSWTITVTTEAGQSLTPKQTWAYDPLHIAAMTVKRFNNSSLSSVPNFITEEFNHFFTVTAPDADTDLTITVSDGHGNTWTEQMARPKPFSTSSFRK